MDLLVHMCLLPLLSAYSLHCLQEYYLLALAQPTRDSKALGSDSPDTSLVKSASSASRPSFLRTVASALKSESLHPEHSTHSSKHAPPVLQLSADGSAVKRSTSQIMASATPASSMIDSSPALISAQALSQTSATQGAAASMGAQQQLQAGPTEHPDHHDEQVLHQKACSPSKKSASARSILLAWASDSQASSTTVILHHSKSPCLFTCCMYAALCSQRSVLAQQTHLQFALLRWSCNLWGYIGCMMIARTNPGVRPKPLGQA